MPNKFFSFKSLLMLTDYLNEEDAVNLFKAFNICINEVTLKTYFGRDFPPVSSGHSDYTQAFFYHKFSLKKIIKNLKSFNVEDLAKTLTIYPHYTHAVFQKLINSTDFKNFFTPDQLKRLLQKLIEYSENFLSKERKGQIIFSEGEGMVKLIINNKRKEVEKIIDIMLKNKHILALISKNNSEIIENLPNFYKEKISPALEQFYKNENLSKLQLR